MSRLATTSSRVPVWEPHQWIPTHVPLSPVPLSSPAAYQEPRILDATDLPQTGTQRREGRTCHIADRQSTPTPYVCGDIAHRTGLTGDEISKKCTWIGEQYCDDRQRYNKEGVRVLTKDRGRGQLTMGYMLCGISTPSYERKLVRCWRWA
ncbi:hypothetical protein L226DRAFT_307381 [Lentinus tigrinus ALCF2SS1-7]|uniref:Uncharacterized protein n=1 Tax=Lentinus tigrinus ALCF2SS1-6 TaxID=1328759 RepID=A0A5C2RXD1_9APHY|nr:hypothetical protein L227DRAFT_299360 [Lentinus tigrinus ALCF2SS1-6]RPD69125.1 hypothetical protein L226DRAFT_307381 [Lentinus tigrinus ALCF2SS1-7]